MGMALCSGAAESVRTSVSLKRKASSSTEYSPTHGMIDFRHFQRAVEAFECNISEEKKLLLATDINLHKWLHSGINEKMGNVFVEAIFKNGDDFTKGTVADLWIVKVQNTPHEIVVGEITIMVGAYRGLHTRLLDVGGGNMTLPGCIRRADTAVRPNPNPAVLNGQSYLPRVLFEVEFQHRTVAQAHVVVLQYFALIPVLQAVVLFVFWGKRGNGSFAAIAILYRRNGAVGTVRVFEMLFPLALQIFSPLLSRIFQLA